MSARKDQHSLDLLGTELRGEVIARLAAMQDELRSGVPIGNRRLSPQEKLQRYMNLSPQQRDYFRQNLGDRWNSYEEEQLRYVVSMLGGAAMNLLPYIAPSMAAALELDNMGTGAMPGPEVDNEQEAIEAI